jgi:hypothetical protein
MNKTINLEEQIKDRIKKERDSEYGCYQTNFHILAMLWSVVLRDKLKEDIQAHEAAQLMMMMKMFRCTTKFKADNYIDLEIYSSMAKELHKKI